MSHYLTVDDLTEYERPVSGPLDTSYFFTVKFHVLSRPENKRSHVVIKLPATRSSWCLCIFESLSQLAAMSAAVATELPREHERS